MDIQSVFVVFCLVFGSFSIELDVLLNQLFVLFIFVKYIKFKIYDYKNCVNIKKGMIYRYDKVLVYIIGNVQYC